MGEQPFQGREGMGGWDDELNKGGTTYGMYLNKISFKNWEV